MKRSLAATLLGAFLLCSPAIAADIPVKGPVYKAAPVFNWNGWYGGINAGYGWDPNYIISTPSEPDAVLPLEPQGGFFGFMIGYNWHYAPNWLIGIEADFHFADISDSTNFTAGGGGANQSTAKIEIQNFGTVRGRLGYVNDRTLFFVTGGVAFANFDLFVNARYDVTIGNIDKFQWETGYVLGLGIEHAFTNGWIGRIEYQFLDFSLTANGTASNGDPFTLRGDPQLHIVKLGLSRKFSTLLP